MTVSIIGVRPFLQSGTAENRFKGPDRNILTHLAWHCAFSGMEKLAMAARRCLKSPASGLKHLDQIPNLRRSYDSALVCLVLRYFSIVIIRRDALLQKHPEQSTSECCAAPAQTAHRSAQPPPESNGN